MQIKAERQVLVTHEQATNEFEERDEGEYPDVSLGTKAGRGRMVKFHDFKCIRKYGSKREANTVKLMPHEEDEIYVPADNRSPEELVKAGEMDKSMLAVFAAREKAGEE